MKIIDRNTAKAQGLKRYYTGVPCKFGHDAPRILSNYVCVACSLEKVAKYQAANPDKVQGYEQRKVYHARYRETNKEKTVVQIAAWRASNKEKHKASIRKWKLDNKDRVCALSAKRNALMLKAMPDNVDTAAIDRIYKQCAKLTHDTGIKHHVDHIVPLQGKTVCGLHVPHNLQILTATENIAKSNRYWPDMAVNYA